MVEKKISKAERASINSLKECLVLNPESLSVLILILCRLVRVGLGVFWTTTTVRCQAKTFLPPAVVFAFAVLIKQQLPQSSC